MLLQNYWKQQLLTIWVMMRRFATMGSCLFTYQRCNLLVFLSPFMFKVSQTLKINDNDQWWHIALRCFLCSCLCPKLHTDDHSGYYQAIAIAKQCHYFLGGNATFIFLTVASHGCFVRRQKYTTNLTVVIMAFTDRGRVEIVKSIPLICERKMKEVNKNDDPLISRILFCNKDGFNITIPQNATVPPLNLDAVWIPSSQSHNCKPKKRSKEAITFSFPFTDCGTQSVVNVNRSHPQSWDIIFVTNHNKFGYVIQIADGSITYWVNIEVKQQLRKGSIFRDTPFQ